MPYARLIVAVAAAALIAIGSNWVARARQAPPLDSAALTAQLQATATDWNKGDLEAFIAPYAADSTFMTKAGPIGRDAMRTRYRENYFAGGRKPRPLRFEQIAVRPLGTDHALMTGRFVLGGDGQPDQSGWFTLVWTRTADGWRMLHDHTS